MDDTSDVARTLQEKIILGMTEGQRLELAFEMSELTRELALAGIRTRHSDWTEAECRRELLRYTFAPEPLPSGLP